MTYTFMLLMSVVTADGTPLVSVRMPYDSLAQCEAAAYSARWVIPAEHGLEATATCVRDYEQQTAT